MVAHDAGSANLIAAWFAQCESKVISGSFDGPAREIFRRQCPWMSDTTLSEHLPKCNALVSGTGWSSAFEHDARRFAGDHGIYSVAVIDHWTNYRERFIRQGREILPDEVWVADTHARDLAESEFPGIPVLQLHNSYLANLIREVRLHERERVATPGYRVLYVLEPIRQRWGPSDQPGEFQALDFFLDNIPALKIGANPTIRLRPHPSDETGKFQRWLKSKGELGITLDESSSLAESIAWADVVVGCQTYAMVVALNCDRRVVSTIPPWGPPCALPQTSIQRLADLI